jgi:hypothetical protein
LSLLSVTFCWGFNKGTELTLADEDKLLQFGALMLALQPTIASRVVRPWSFFPANQKKSCRLWEFPKMHDEDAPPGDDAAERFWITQGSTIVDEGHDRDNLKAQLEEIEWFVWPGGELDKSQVKAQLREIESKLYGQPFDTTRRSELTTDLGLQFKDGVWQERNKGDTREKKRLWWTHGGLARDTIRDQLREIESNIYGRLQMVDGTMQIVRPWMEEGQSELNDAMIKLKSYIDTYCAGGAIKDYSRTYQTQKYLRPARPRPRS